jgi:hypothetical protein
MIQQPNETCQSTCTGPMYSVVLKRKPFQYEIFIKMHHSVLRWFVKEKKAVVAKVLAKKLTRREKSC